MITVVITLSPQDYLNAYLPLDKGQIGKLFTQQSQQHNPIVSPPSPQVSPLSPPSATSTVRRPTLFRSDFASRLDSGGGGGAVTGADQTTFVAAPAAAASVQAIRPINHVVQSTVVSPPGGEKNYKQFDFNGRLSFKATIKKFLHICFLRTAVTM